MAGNTLTIKFINFSTTTFNLDQNGYTTEAGLGQLNEWPSSGTQLLAMDGEQICQYDQEALNNIADGDVNIYCCWNNGVERIGVKIVSPKQGFDMGDRPYWEIMYDQTPYNNNIDWIKSGSNPAYQYTWPSSVGYNIIGTPDSEHTSLAVNVQISNIAVNSPMPGTAEQETKNSDKSNRKQKPKSRSSKVKALQAFRKTCQPHMDQPANVGTSLLIFYYEPDPDPEVNWPGGWVAMDGNEEGPPPFIFAGDNYAEQLDSVNQLAVAMNTGDAGTVNEVIATVFDLPDDFITNPEMVTNILFQFTNTLYYSGLDVFAAAEGSLLDFLMQAGEALLTAIAGTELGA